MAKIQAGFLYSKPAFFPVVKIMAVFVIQLADHFIISLHQAFDYCRYKVLFKTRKNTYNKQTEMVVF